MKTFAAAVLIGGMVLSAAQPVLAETAAQREARQREYARTHHVHHYNASCERYRRHEANRGTAVGALGGALLGGGVFHSAGGAIGGAVVGGVAGHSVASHGARRDCYRR